MSKITGGCHCGKVKWQADVEIETVMECNCSHCSRKGFLLAFLPVDNFTLVSDADEEREYLFNKKHISHLFCKTCGVQSHGVGTGPDGTKMAMINVRCAVDVDVSKLKVQQVDGKSL